MARMPMMDAANHGQTADGQPMPDLLKLAETMEGRDGILCASIQIGFPWSDVPDIGPNVVVTATDVRQGRAAAGELMQAVWQSRHDTQLEFATPQEAMMLAKRGQDGDKPLVLADFADNPAGGAYGDSPNLLRAMIAQGLERAAFATISDPASVERAAKAGIGAKIQLSLGGKGAPDLTPPLEVEERESGDDSSCSEHDGKMVDDMSFEELIDYIKKRHEQIPQLDKPTGTLPDVVEPGLERWPSATGVRAAISCHIGCIRNCGATAGINTGAGED